MAKLNSTAPGGAIKASPGEQAGLSRAADSGSPAAPAAPEVAAAPDMPLLFEKPRRRLGCGLWFVILVVLMAAGATASWQLMDSQEKENLKARLTDFVRETPLQFLRSYLLPYLEANPPIPPINASGDKGILPERTKSDADRAAREAAPLPQETHSDSPLETHPGLHPNLLPDPQAGAEVTGSIAHENDSVPPSETQPDMPGEGTDPENPDGAGASEDAAPIPVVQEDERVRPVFVDDLASWVVRSYRPGSQQGKGGSLPVSVQSMNLRYGTKLTGLATSLPGGPGRAQILRYAFTPSMIRGLYDIYADAFLRSIARTAQSREKPLTAAQLGHLYQSLGARSTLLAGGLESVAGLPELPARLAELDRHEEAVAQANRHLLDTRFDLEQAREAGQGVRQAQTAVNQATRQLQATMQQHTAAQARLAEDIRRNGAGAINDQTALYLARWVGRRLADNPSALAGVREASAVLRDLAGRCARAAREGAPAQKTSAPNASR